MPKTKLSRPASYLPARRAIKKANQNRRRALPSPSSSTTVAAPVAVSRPLTTVRGPSFTNRGAATSVSNCELVTVLQRDPGAGTAFQTFSFEIQPGALLTFPWLSVIATRYETYQFRKLVFRFSSRATTITGGTVGCVFDHDPIDTAPSTLVSAMAYHDRIAYSPWVSWEFPIDLRGSSNHPLFTRPGIVANTDLKTYDIGTISAFLDGITSDGTVGLLEVDYTVDLFIPQIEDAIGDATGTVRGNTGLSTTNLLGPNGSIVAGSPKVSLDIGTGILTFLQPFEGLITATLAGLNLAGQLGIIPAGSVAWSLIHSAYGLSQQMVSAKTKMPKGGTIHPTYSGSGSFSVSDFDFLEAPYNSLV